MTPEMIDQLAQAAYIGWSTSFALADDLVAWDDLGSVHCRAWRSTVRAVLEALPEPEPALLPVPVFTGYGQPVDGLKPGDVVSVRGVVESGNRSPAQTLVRFASGLGYEVGPLYFSPDRLTFIERPAPPEPTWAPGDLAEDNDGKRYAYPGGDGVRPWLRTTAPAMWLKRDEIPGPLHKLTVTREGEGQ